MTRQTLERLCYIAAHRLTAMEPSDSLMIPAKQFATAGKRRSVAVDRIAEVIASVFDGADEAELSHMMNPVAEEWERRRG